MNRRTIFISVALALLVGAALFYPASSFASGGSTWKMTCKNPTTFTASVNFYWQDAPLSSTGANFTIPPGGSHTFNVPGSKCPGGFTGSIIVDGGRRVDLQTSNCLGTGHSTTLFTACCWNVTFDICKVVSSDDTYIDINDYGFCKR